MDWKLRRQEVVKLAGERFQTDGARRAKTLQLGAKRVKLKEAKRKSAATLAG